MLLTHLLLGGIGWFTGVIIGVSYRVIPMFLLAHGHDERHSNTILYVLYGGMILGIVGALWNKGGGVVLTGIAVVSWGDLTNQRMGDVVFPWYHVTLIVTVVAAALGEATVAQVAAGGFVLANLLLLLDVLLLVMPVHDLWAGREREGRESQVPHIKERMH